MKPSEAVKGVRVSWTHCSSSGRTLTMVLREGVIVSVEKHVVTVEKSSGRREQVTLDRLRIGGQKTRLTEFVEAMVNSNRRRQDERDRNV